MKQVSMSETILEDCCILYPHKYGDERGFFSPYFIQENYDELGFQGVVQANRSKSAKGVLRGLHFQYDPKCQAKIVEVINGKALDVVVDLRYDSPSYCKWISVLLSPEKNNQLFVPRGFAHGFLSLEDDTIFQYLIDNDYDVTKEGGIPWNDPTINIPWDNILEEYNIKNPNLSEKDTNREPFNKELKLFKRNK